jgi:hypothetical protein
MENRRRLLSFIFHRPRRASQHFHVMLGSEVVGEEEFYDIEYKLRALQQRYSVAMYRQFRKNSIVV